MANFDVTAFMSEFKIGCHISKQKSLSATIETLPTNDRPYQIFLGGPQNTAMRNDPKDFQKTAQLLADRPAPVFVHSQYIINLATIAEGDAWNTDLLKKNLQYAAAAGLSGVVVHVGKSVKLDKKIAIENMRKNLEMVVKYATESCPLLLETPAGQGTELLTDATDFLKFVLSVPGLKVCVDTCHVFASGYDPLEYLEIFDTEPDLVKLVHFNDSKEGCGSCKDRHAVIGSGEIGSEKMQQLAEACKERKYPMVFE